VIKKHLRIQPKPPWLKVRFPTDPNFFYTFQLIKENKLHTICQSAACPNRTECWSHRTATFLVMGDVCTRNCSFCAVRSGDPAPLTEDEKERVTAAIASMGLAYAVITSVTRDDLPDGGAGHLAKIIDCVKERNPGVKLEMLVPDFKGSEDALRTVIVAGPDVLNHNIEVPRSLYPLINRPQENYHRSLELLAAAKRMRVITKSGMMIGLGEKKRDILDTLEDLRRSGCDLLTIGQYLQPSAGRSSVLTYSPPSLFDDLKKRALKMGFADAECGPLVRSSYNAHKMYKKMQETAM
jgi:lipoic acid synthetase